MGGMAAVAVRFPMRMLAGPYGPPGEIEDRGDRPVPPILPPAE